MEASQLSVHPQDVPRTRLSGHFDLSLLIWAREASNKTHPGRNMRSQFFRGSLSLILVKSSATLLLFIQQVLVAQLSGSESYGVYAYVQGWVALLVVLTPLGFDTTSVRYVSVYQSSNQFELMKGFLIRGLQFVVLVSALVSLLIILIGYGAPSGSSSELLHALWWGALLLPALAALQFGTSILQGLRNVHLSFLLRSVTVPLLGIFGVLSLTGLWYWKTGYALSSFDALKVEFFAASIVLLTLCTVIFARLHRLRACESRFATREWLATAIPVWAHIGFKLAMNKSGIILIGILIGTVSSGLFAAALQASNLISFGLLAVNSLAAPQIAQLFAENKFDDLQRLVTSSTRIALAFAVGSGVILLLFGKVVLGMFGAQFSEAYFPLCILIGGQILNSFSGPVGSLLVMTKQQRYSAKVGFLTFVLNIVMIPILILEFGLLGAAMGTVLTGLVWNLLLIRRVRRVLGLNPTLLASLDVS